VQRAGVELLVELIHGGSSTSRGRLAEEAESVGGRARIGKGGEEKLCWAGM
jgi:hypothetical protein